MTTSTVEPGYKYIARRDDSPTSSDARPGGTLGKIAETFGEVLNGLVETIGKVLGGAADLAVGAFEWILSGVQNILRDVFKTLGALLSKNPPNVLPTYASPIRADLEAAIKPMLDRIAENDKVIESSLKEIDGLLEKQADISKKYDSVLEEQKAILKEQEEVAKAWDVQFGELQNASSAVSKKVDELVTFKDGMDARIAAAMQGMKDDLDLANQLQEAQKEVEKKIAEGLTRGGDLADKITALTSAPDGQSFAEFWQDNGQKLLDMQQWYNQWNRGQWESQKEWNDLQANWNARVTATLDRQVRINADQSSFNEFVTDFVKMQKWYNENNTSLWKMQQQFNDKTTGWQAKQEELNTLNRDFQREQRATSSNFRTILGRLKANQDELVEISKEQAEFIFRKIVAQRKGSQATENEHWYIEPNTGNLTAKGSWSGEASVRTYGSWRPPGEQIIYTSSEELYPIPQLDGSRSIKISATGLDTIAIDYSVARGRRIIDVYPDGGLAGSYVPSQSTWVRLNRFTVQRSTVHRFTFDVIWDAATFHNQYGVRVRRNGTVIASIGPRDMVGPLTPLGDGTRPMSIPEQSVSLSKGDTLDFEVYTSGDEISTRRLNTYTRTVSYQTRD